ncbi:MAG: hypothetical protein JWR10_960 [Rubritepida sp.]|nr:hypothetical protein [Rubritepida sp.]
MSADEIRTRSITADQDRTALLAHCAAAGLRAVSMRLLAGMPGGSRTDRIKARAFADGYAKAAADIAEAIGCAGTCRGIPGRASAAHVSKDPGHAGAGV